MFSENELRERLMDVPLHDIALQEVTLGHLILGLTKFAENRSPVLMQVYLGIQQGLGRDITLRDMAAVMRGEYQDPIYQAVCECVIELAQRFSSEKLDFTDKECGNFYMKLVAIELCGKINEIFTLRELSNVITMANQADLSVTDFVGTKVLNILQAEA